ncbi:uncharacterized protein [Haliotis asinina]|uniref:uncharacterized protein isoform X1 n=1 Tax=Haliotis asinina TaxID=109174 RepID=UPI003531CC62
MEGSMYTVQEIIDYFEGKRTETFNSEIESFARGNAQTARAFRTLVRERSIRINYSDAVAQSNGYDEVMEDEIGKEEQSKGIADEEDKMLHVTRGIKDANVTGGGGVLDEKDSMQHVTRNVQAADVTEGDDILDEKDSLQHVTRDMQAADVTGGDGILDEEDSMQHMTRDVQAADVTEGDGILDEEDSMSQVTKSVQDVYIKDIPKDDIGNEEDSMKHIMEVSSDAVVKTSDAGVEHTSGVTGGDVDNSTVVGVVKGGMRNKQTVIDSDICITGSRGEPDGDDDDDADHKLKDVAGVAGGAVKDSTVVGEVHGGMDNVQTIENSKIYSDGSFGGNLQFLDLNIRQRDDCGEPGGVQSFKDCIIDLRKPEDVTQKDEEIDETEPAQDQGESASRESEISPREPDDGTETQDMQKKIQEVKDQSEREEEERRLMQQKQAAMEEQLLNEQRQRQWMQAEMQRIAYEQQRHAAYGRYPIPVTGHPYPPPVTPAVIGYAVAPATPMVTYVRPQSPRPTGTGLLKNIKQFIKGRKQ